MPGNRLTDVAECIQLANVVALLGFRFIATGEVIGAEIGEHGLLVGEQMPDDHQYRTAYRDDRSFLAPTPGHAAVASRIHLQLPIPSWLAARVRL